MAARSFPGVTIDGIHSRDLDDAIWVEKADGGWKVTVSISLVATRVAKGSDIDLAALAAAFTRYARDEVRTPMLPTELSETALTLTPQGWKEVIAYVIHLDDDLEVTGLEIETGLLDHRGRLDQAEAGRLSRAGQGPVGEMLARTWDLSVALLAARRKAGAIAWFSEETGVVTSEEGQPISIGGGRDKSRGYLMVQELMILTNRAVADRFVELEIPLVYRNHRSNALADRSALREDLELSVGDGALGEVAEKRLLSMLGRATVSPKATGHFGLNLPFYAWMTSPIRRYPDLVNQRIVLAHVRGEPMPYTVGELESVCAAYNEAVELDRPDKDASIKENKLRRAARQTTPEQLARLDGDGISAVIKNANITGDVTPELVDELESRMAANSLTPKDIGRILCVEGEAALEARRMIMACLFAAPNLSVSVLNYLASVKFVDAIRYGEGMEGATFVMTVSADTAKGAHTATSRASSKKTAQQKAATELLAEVTGSPWEPPADWTSGAAAVPRTQTAGAVSAVEDLNAKGALITYCQLHKLPMPQYEMGQVGPSHSPVFTASASVKTRAGTVSVGPLSAGNRREVERMAAAALLAQLKASAKSVRAAAAVLSEPLREQAPVSPDDTTNWKGALGELCQKRKWPAPIYETELVQQSPTQVFRTVALIVADGRNFRSGPAQAHLKKESERLAAGELASMFL